MKCKNLSQFFTEITVLENYLGSIVPRQYFFLMRQNTLSDFHEVAGPLQCGFQYIDCMGLRFPD